MDYFVQKISEDVILPMVADGFAFRDIEER
jgi:hypothetical protein